MKIKVLLIGRNKVLMEDFFLHLEEDFEMQTSSMRYPDISSHITYFKPDVLMYCMNNEEQARTDIVISLEKEIRKNNVALILTGNQDECDRFQRMSGGMGELILKKPITARSIRDKVIEFIGERKKDEPVSEVKAETVSVPASAPAPTSVSAPVSAAQPKMPEKAENSTGKKHVLVVDDNAMMLRLIKEQLRDYYEVATAISGKIALKFLESRGTDLVLLDYEMPNEDGAQILEQIRTNPATADLPVVFLTGVTEKEKVRKIVGFKPQGYLVKPIESEVLFETIKSVIG